MNRILPTALRPGDRVAVVSPSWGAAGLFPERFDRALRAFGDTTGLEVVESRHARSTLDWRSADAASRAADLHEAITDPRIAGIFFAIGGDHAAQVLPLLDLDAFRTRPKVVCGYSDATVLHHALYAATGVTTFYGPAVVPQFGEIDGPDAVSVTALTAATMRAEPFVVPQVPYVIQEYLDWADKSSRPRTQEPTPGRTVLRDGEARGPILAGCLPSACQLLGTPWQPPYEDHVLFLDVPDEHYGPADVDRDLTHLRNAGLLHGLAALVVSRVRGASEATRATVREIVLRAVAGTTYPVLVDVEFGHTDPIATLPIGVDCSIRGVEIAVDPAATDRNNSLS